MEECLRTNARHTPRIPRISKSDFHLQMLMAYNKHIFVKENIFIFSTIHTQKLQMTHFLHFIIIDTTIKITLHHHHHVPEGLGMFSFP